MTLAAVHWLQVALALPAHSELAQPLIYRHGAPVAPGMLVRVPLGRRMVLGVVWACSQEAPAAELAAKVRDVEQVLDGLPLLAPRWRGLVEFVAHYYHRGLGEVALSALPPQLRDLSAVQLQRRLQRLQRSQAQPAAAGPVAPSLTADQAAVLAQWREDPDAASLLWGVTGSGKTELYMRAASDVLARDATTQVLVLVPEINLTPQLEERFSARFGTDCVVAMHSGLTPAQRLRAWLAAHLGRARIVLGTRIAILASLPGLGLIVVDEEHDPSYKQQEGARYSARDLALYRAQQARVPVLLGSATPSLESWWASMPRSEGGRGRLRRLVLPRRVGQTGAGAGLPRVHRVDMSRQPRGTLVSPPLLRAISSCVQDGRQVLLLLNRRGYAPLLHCRDCGWKSECPHCSAYRVFHKVDRSLRCHHCGLGTPAPRACPNCGNADLHALGRGTEQLEEHLQQELEPVRRPDGSPLRVLRMDADTARSREQMRAQLAQVHTGAADVLVGTQMIAKGHDFRNVALAAAINPDVALYSSDFRAPERLFALLLQVAGRAGRDADAAVPAQVWIQTEQPQHPLYQAVKQHDYPGFAAQQLAERRQAGLPPFVHLALLRADARQQQQAQRFLAQVAERVHAAVGADPRGPQALAHVKWYPPVPLPVQRVARVERAQMLLESHSRAALQQVLSICSDQLRALRRLPPFRSHIVRWAIDVDPLVL